MDHRCLPSSHALKNKIKDREENGKGKMSWLERERGDGRLGLGVIDGKGVKSMTLCTCKLCEPEHKNKCVGFVLDKDREVSVHKQ